MAGNLTLANNRDFKSWVSQLKQDIRSAQIKAAIKVNIELLRLYWRMGADICEKQTFSFIMSALQFGNKLLPKSGN